MATVSGILKDASVNGKPRDLSDIIYDISPTDTPFMTMCGKVTAKQTLHEWQTDSLATPAANSVLEGADTSSFAESNTTECFNRTQILKKAVSVSGTAQAVDQAGVDDQYNFQIAQRLKELKRDLELALLTNQIERVEAGADTRLMRGLPCWLTTNKDLGSGGSAATTAAACTAGTARVPTQAMVDAVLLSCYNAGGNPNTIMMAPAIRQKMSSVLGSGNTKMERVEDKKAYSTVEVYVSDFGALKLVPNRVQANDTYAAKCAFVLDPEYWKVAYLRGFKDERLAVTGDSVKGQIIVEATLEARNEASSGMIADLKKA